MFKKSKLMVCMAILAAMFIAVPATVTVNAMTQGNFEFEVVGGQMTIVEFTGTGGSVTIPNTAPNGAAVVAIGERAFADVALTAVTFQSPSSIHTIRQEAFRWSDVNNITLPNSLRTIEAGAFRNTRLAQVTIPSGVEHIGHQAFRDVTTLREAHFLHLDGRDITLGNNVFTNVASNFEITRLPQATHFGSNWYPPHTVRASDAPFTDGADWRWTALTGNNIMITGIAANSDLATAQRIEIPSQIDGRTVRRIQNRAFDHHPNLREVVIPATINEIEARAFNNNSRLVAAYFLHTDGNTVEFRPEAFFGFHNDFTIFYPAGARGFTTPYWRELPARPHESEGAWESTVLAGTNELMITRFTGDASIVTVPSTLDGRRVSYIGNDVIRNNNTITELIIPDTIVSIAANAVVNAPNLRIIRLRHMYADTLHLSGLAFSGLHRDFTILFPANSEGFTTPLFVGFPAEPDLFGANWEFTISGGAATITRYHGEEEHATIPEYIDGVPVRIIATGAFRDNDTLLRVTIPATVTTIQPNAFYNCRRLYSAHLLHTNASTLTNFARNSFVGVATYFRIVFPNNATGFTTPTWNGYFAAPEADALTLRQDNFEYIIRREAIQGTSGP
ncbi:MAG: leucine-rich repeat domain-containing protein, partial [Defluviitaleaceae bacterium]|nr:leucine-rich repeat domain-containing protein [Defluviitaleaceae bacterium]